MDWNKYCLEFEREAKNSGKGQQYCDKWLDYAKKLYEQNLPIIYSPEHFCMLVGYMEEYVYAVSNSPMHFYRHYSIKKKAGGLREISEPLPSLKEIQRWILDNILAKVPVSPYAKAYVKNRSIKENARFHRKQKIVLSLDIEKFFDKISSDKIYDIFIKFGYKKEVAVLLTNLCCLHGSLPQGAPTSPTLSNMVMIDFDNNISNFTRDKKIRYTRYADDMTFSGDFNPGQIISYVKRNLNPLGLKLNGDKTRTRKQGQRQEVTGIVVNQQLQIAKSERKKIRQQMYYIKKYGLESHLKHCAISKENYLLHLRGIIQHALFINPYDKELKSYIIFLNEKYGNY